MELRVNPVFFWHGFGHLAVLQKNKLNKINHLRDIFYLNFDGLVLELVEDGNDGTYRAAYTVKFAEAVFVLDSAKFSLQFNRPLCSAEELTTPLRNQSSVPSKASYAGSF